MRLPAFALLVFSTAAAYPLSAQAQPQAQSTSPVPGVEVIRTTTPGVIPGMAPGVSPMPSPDEQALDLAPTAYPEPAAMPVPVPLDDGTPPTALEQGLVDPQAQARLRQALEDLRERSSARQRGVVVPAPTLANPVAVNPNYREWLLNWEFVLTALGMGKEKVRFEASRLSHADFQAWASRQFRFRQPLYSHVEVLQRPGPCQCPDAPAH